MTRQTEFEVLEKAIADLKYSILVELKKLLCPILRLLERELERKEEDKINDLLSIPDPKPSQEEYIERF